TRGAGFFIERYLPLVDRDERRERGEGLSDRLPLEDRVGLPVAAQHIRCGGDGECDGEVKLRQRCVSTHHASVALFASRGSPPANRAARGGGFVRQREREAANASRPPMSP